MITNKVTYTVESGKTADEVTTAECPTETKLIGGGATQSGVVGELITDGPVIAESIPSNTWEAHSVPDNESGETAEGTLTAVAYCAKVE